MRYFESLNRMVQTEPWLTRDKAMIDQLKSIGIENGKPFNPDSKMQDTLKAAVHEAHAWLANKYENSYFPPPYYEGGHWYLPASPEVIEGLQTFFATPDKYPVDSRGVAYTIGWFSAKHLGAGQFYLMTFTDKDGHHLDGGSTYRLNVPTNAPVTQYLSATAYDGDTHALIRNMQWASRSSQTPRFAEERGRVRRPLLQSQSAVGQGIELGSHQRRGKIRSPLPSLWATEAPLRQDLEAARHREDQLKQCSRLEGFHAKP
jgi:hypothetical protein